MQGQSMLETTVILIIDLLLSELNKMIKNLAPAAVVTCHILKMALTKRTSITILPRILHLILEAIRLMEVFMDQLDMERLIKELMLRVTTQEADIHRLCPRIRFPRHLLQPQHQSRFPLQQQVTVTIRNNTLLLRIRHKEIR
jgi:hypothetical protein